MLFSAGDRSINLPDQLQMTRRRDSGADNTYLQCYSQRGSGTAPRGTLWSRHPAHGSVRPGGMPTTPRLPKCRPRRGPGADKKVVAALTACVLCAMVL